MAKMIFDEIARNRLTRRLGLEAGILAEGTTWLEEDALASMERQAASNAKWSFLSNILGYGGMASILLLAGTLFYSEAIQISDTPNSASKFLRTVIADDDKPMPLTNGSVILFAGLFALAIGGTGLMRTDRKAVGLRIRAIEGQFPKQLSFRI